MTRHTLASVWVQRKPQHYESSSGQYVDIDALLPVLRKKYIHPSAIVYSNPTYGKFVRLARDRQKPPSEALTERLPVDEAWPIFEAHVRML